jgi:molybdate transport system substrate-binding protein
MSQSAANAKPAPDRRAARSKAFLAGLLWAIASFALATGALAADVNVMISGGFSAAYRALTPEYERMSGNHLATFPGPSMGTTKDAIPVRLARGEPADVLIMVGYALDDLIKQGRVVPGSRVDLARSSIYMAVKAGAPRPDIGSVDAFRRVLLAAKSVAYSDSASGVYIHTEMFQRLGIAEQMKATAREIPAAPVGEAVARGEAELGFQQLSELMPVPGIDIVGPLPAELQKVTVFSAGIATNARSPGAAKALIQFLASPAAIPAIQKSGLEPTARPSI